MILGRASRRQTGSGESTDADTTRELLNSQVEPAVSADAAENASGAGDRIRAAAESSDDVTLDEVEIREVVASA
jgi:hypothetical protein